jgi:hypothetical protein
MLPSCVAFGNFLANFRERQSANFADFVRKMAQMNERVKNSASLVILSEDFVILRLTTLHENGERDSPP